MYFSDITNSELQYYHKKTNNNFSASLKKEVLVSDLFKIEHIIGNIYKVYPLFYCEKIESTNPNDKILDNKCIICEKNNNTRLYFNSNNPNTVDLCFASTLLDERYSHTGKLFIEYNSSTPSFIIFDKNTGRFIEGVEVKASLINENNENYEDTGYTNKDGIVYLDKLNKSNYNFIKGLITMEYMGITKTIWEKV